MARTPNTPAVDVDPSQPGTDIQAAQIQAAERSAQILARFGDNLPFDLPRYEHVISNHLRRSADEMLAAGRALIVVREHVPHGEWLATLARLKLEPRMAQRMAQAAFKFSNAATSTHLIEAAGNKSKLLELMTLDDDEIAELNAGGTVVGITLDDIDTMSTSELRKKLREARAENDSNEKLLDEKNGKLDKLEKDLAATKRRIKAEPPSEHVVKLRQEFAAEVTSVEGTIRQVLREGIEKMRQAGMESGEADLSHDKYASESLMLIQHAIIDVADEFGLTILAEADSDEVPAWAKQG